MNPHTPNDGMSGRGEPIGYLFGLPVYEAPTPPSGHEPPKIVLMTLDDWVRQVRHEIFREDLN